MPPANPRQHPVTEPSAPWVDTDSDAIFDLAPVSLWLEDFSALRSLFERWRAEGVTDLAAHLAADPARIQACMHSLRVLRVNPRTLALFKAPDQATLCSRLHEVFRDEMRDHVVRELLPLWNGQTLVENQTVNYTLDGERLDVLVRMRILPGHESTWDRVLVSLEDLTARIRAENSLSASERYARDLFERSPVSLWVEDFSAVKALLDEVRRSGIEDFRVFLKVHPEFVTRCMQEIRVIDVNRQTLKLFGAPDKTTLLARLHEIFRDEMTESFAEQLHELWAGRYTQEREVINHSLAGDTLHLHMQFAVLEDHLDCWDLVLVSLVDITARKKAEAYLEYLGKHDVLTRLRNRAFFNEELSRLARKGPWPVAVLAIDVNGLKEVNDDLGHAAGDALLRRAGEVLGKAVDAPGVAARIGGDEFVVLLPGCDEAGAQEVQAQIQQVLELNNQFYPGRTLSLSMGLAVCPTGGSLEAALQAADRAMYEDKARYYEHHAPTRRRSDRTPAG
ncbi:diguanylate cyclase [uncultured Tepidimonas sp.]|uniref:sensor domain-containing diguanylate cyclase n=1 Tax=uncultured Tepidimonas sp. TaxID=453579 RepID=UPI002615D017|nr:diguanylate cyclase [uncultured Tepidimonas sp.]